MLMDAAEPSGPRRCYACLRPVSECYCATLPTIANRTEVLILQHRRERFHPFNTARIVRRSLLNSTLLVDHTPRLAEQLQLKPRAALLYPGAEATLISDVAPEQFPEQLVVVDGTWHQAKTLVRDISVLRDLPRYRLAPVEPSSYRIRREPNAMALSTVEAVVAALRVFEPETRGLDQLLASFNSMVERQLAHPKSGVDAKRRLIKHSRTVRNIPWVLVRNLANIVVAYGECLPGERGVRRSQQTPLVWVAERLISGERFATTIQPDTMPDETLLAHLRLTPTKFVGAPTLEEARAAWQAFLRPSDLVTIYGPSTRRLLERLSGRDKALCLVLKAIDFLPERRYRTLDELVVGEQLAVEPSDQPGRAGQRLANAKALVRHLHQLASGVCSSRVSP